MRQFKCRNGPVKAMSACVGCGRGHLRSCQAAHCVKRCCGCREHSQDLFSQHPEGRLSHCGVNTCLSPLKKKLISQRAKNCRDQSERAGGLFFAMNFSRRYNALCAGSLSSGRILLAPPPRTDSASTLPDKHADVPIVPAQRICSELAPYGQRNERDMPASFGFGLHLA